MFELRKRINRIKIKLSYSLGLSKVFGMPKLITLEPTNHCNLKCPLCPTGEGDTSVAYGLFKLDKYKKVVDVFSKWAQTVQLFSWGEPLLNKSFVEMVRYTSQDPYKIRSTTSVNLNLITDEQIKGLLTSNLDALHVSIDGTTQEVYEKYRVGGNLEVVFSNLNKLIAAKKFYKANTKINWAFLVFKHNEHQVEEAKKMARDFGISITIKEARPNIKGDLHNSLGEMIDTYGKWLPDNPKYNAYNMDAKTRKTNFLYNYGTRQKPLKFCKRPWWQTFINWNGDVFPCDCVHTEEKYRMGNIFEQDFKEIWNGEKYVAARKELLDQPNDLDTICHTCKRNGFYTTL
jgi:radical SAM protein with 4Fe4S-binding SPASM domain